MHKLMRKTQTLLTLIGTKFVPVEDFFRGRLRAHIGEKSRDVMVEDSSENPRFVERESNPDIVVETLASYRSAITKFVSLRDGAVEHHTNQELIELNRWLEEMKSQKSTVISSGTAKGDKGMKCGPFSVSCSRCRTCFVLFFFACLFVLFISIV